MKKIGLLSLLLLLTALVVTVGTAIATGPVVIETDLKPADDSLAMVELAEAACVADGAGALATGDEFSFSATRLFPGIGTGNLEYFAPEVDRNDNKGHGNDPDGCDANNPGKKACDPRDHFVGSVMFATCLPNGVTIIEFAGTGTWNGVSGYTFDVLARDGRDTTAPDFYQIEITAPDGTTITHFVSGEPVSGYITATQP